MAIAKKRVVRRASSDLERDYAFRQGAQIVLRTDLVIGAIVSESPSHSPSASPSESPSTSASESPSASVSASPSSSPSPSSSISGSPSSSPSASVSGSPSESISASLSGSPSSSPSATGSSPSSSPSESPSESVSASPSGSPSASASGSPSASPSASISGSPSASVSASPSSSPSHSASSSPSTSVSASPSSSASLGAGESVTDDFNRANATLAGNWTCGFATQRLSIVSNHVENGTTNNSVSYWNANTFNDDHDSQATVGNLSSGNYAAVNIRCSGVGATFNAYEFYTDGLSGSGHTGYGYYLNGTWYEAGVLTTTFTAGDVIKISMHSSGASQVIRFWKNGVKVGSDWSDNRFQSGGTPGINIYGNATIDNWSGGYAIGVSASTSPSASPSPSSSVSISPSSSPSPSSSVSSSPSVSPSPSSSVSSSISSSPSHSVSSSPSASPSPSSSPSASAAPGTYHYVRAGASGANNGSNWTDAWSDLPTSFIRGHTYYVAAGTYGTHTFNTANSGVTTITVKKATIADHGTSTGWSDSYGDGTSSIPSIVVSTGYWIISGFLFTNPGYPEASAAVRLTGSYNQILNNTFYGNGNPMVDGEGTAIALSTQGAYNQISYNTFDGRSNGSNTSFGIVFYVGTSSSYNTWSYNLIKDCSAPGRIWELYGANHHIHNNEVSNCQGSPTSVDHPDIFQVFGTAGAHDMLIENNYFHDFSGQIGNLGIDGNDSLWYNWTFRNNVFANMQEMFIYFPVEFYNNTFYRCALNNGIVLQSAYRQGHTTNKNNAFIACGTATNNGWYGGPNTSDYNFVCHTATGGTKSGFSETHGINGGNPQIVAYSNNCATGTCNFHIGATSVLKDAGVTIASFSTDQDGVSRPQGSAWDIGAFEYVP